MKRLKHLEKEMDEDHSFSKIQPPSFTNPTLHLSSLPSPPSSPPFPQAAPPSLGSILVDLGKLTHQGKDTLKTWINSHVLSIWNFAKFEDESVAKLESLYRDSNDAWVRRLLFISAWTLVGVTILKPVISW